MRRVDQLAYSDYNPATEKQLTIYNRNIMDLIDSIKQFSYLIDANLKRRHLAALSAVLFITLLSSAPQAQDESSDTLSSDIEPSYDQQETNSSLSIAEYSSSPSLSSSTLTPPMEILNPSSRLNIEVKSGDNLSLIFARAGLSPQDVLNVSQSGEDANILSNLHPGYILIFEVSVEGILNQLEVIKTPLESILFTRTSKTNFISRHLVRSPNIEQTFKQAVIEDSLFMAAQRGGISAPITMEIAGIFGSVIDFLLDTREGDTFNVLYEEEYLDGNFISNGSILGTQFINRGEVFTALRYINSEGKTDYYNPQGESMSKAFLLNPVDYVRISDGFNPARKHPILNTIRAHKGTDYAAPRGTPIVATSDGVITWAARNGSFGKLITIQHGEKFQTKYAHLSDYASGINKGATVTQGQVIGYVGTTGSSTGPHLHYEFLMDGVHRNSRTIFDKLPVAESVPEIEMNRFHEQTDHILADLESHTQPAKAVLAQAFN